eukprot:COSAG02_NODE_581_length_20056_cov_9.304906_8_plen_51_part_00
MVVCVGDRRPVTPVASSREREQYKRFLIAYATLAPAADKLWLTGSLGELL